MNIVYLFICGWVLASFDSILGYRGLTSLKTNYRFKYNLEYSISSLKHSDRTLSRIYSEFERAEPSFKSKSESNSEEKILTSTEKKNQKGVEGQDNDDDDTTAAATAAADDSEETKISDAMKARLLRELQSQGADPNYSAGPILGNPILLISGILVILILAGGKGIFF